MTLPTVTGYTFDASSGDINELQTRFLTSFPIAFPNPPEQMIRHNVRRAFLTLLVATAPAALVAQQTPATPPTAPAPAPAPAAAPAPATVNFPVEFSGVLFPQFIYGGAKGNGTRSANQFQLDRAYLTAKAKVADRTSIRLTADVYRPGGNSSYTLRAKYAFVQYDYWLNNEGFLGANGQVRLGMQQTIIIDTEEQFWPRYVAKAALERGGYFSSSDLGASTTLSFGKGLGELFAMVANGPGYTTPENDRFKDYSARLTLTPFGSTLAHGLVIAPWIYKGTVASPLRPSEGRKHNRAGIFSGYKAPAFMIGGTFARATNENERAVPNGIATDDRSGSLFSVYAHLKPLVMLNPAGNKTWGILLRADNITGDNGYVPSGGDFPVVKGRFLVAGLTHDVNTRLSWSLDYQQQSPNGVAAPALDLRTYNLHVSVAF